MEKQKLDFVIDAKVGEFVTNLRTAKGSIDGIAGAIKTMFSGLNTGKTASAQLKAVKADADALLATLKKYQAAGKVEVKQLAPGQKAGLEGALGQIKAGVVGARPSAISAAEAKLEAAATKQKIALKKQEEKAAKEKLAVETSAAKAAEAVIKKDLAVRNAATKEQMAMMNRSITLRYALYDVSSVTRSASDALLGFAGAVVTAQAAQESAFSSIEKTQAGSETTTQQLTDLKNELIALSTEIPVSFAELSKIGMLGAQLGVLTPDLASFTETVAKFSSVTGVSVEETAMGFGKVANLLGLSGDQYQSLGAAIAKVGVSSAATETQIINTAGQISAIAKAAGLSASEIIGLSSAFASLKIAPEEARSVTIQTFQAMDAASRSYSEGLGIGNERLSAFAQISRAGASALLDSAKATGASTTEIAKLTDLSEMTAGDFAKQWGDKAGGAGQVWKTFVTGLGKVDTGKALVQLGLDGIRTSKGLTALGNTAEDVFKQIDIAGAAGAEGTFLDLAANTVIEDIASKLKMLENSFDNLFASAGSSPALINAIGGALDIITDFNVVLTQTLQKNEFAATAAAIVVGVTAIIGGFAALVTVAAASAGGFLAIRTAFLNYISTSTGAIAGTNAFVAGLLRIPGPALAAAVATRAVATATTTVAVSTPAATAAVTAFKWAIRGLIGATGIGLLVVAIGFLIEMLSGAEDAVEPVTRGLDEAGKATNEAAQEMRAFSQELVDLVSAASATEKSLANTESALFNLGKSLQGGKNDFSIYSEAGRANLLALESVMQAMAAQAGMDQQSLANNLLGLAQSMTAAGIGSAEAFARISDAIANTNKTAIAANVPLTSLMAGMQGVTKSAGTAKTALEKLDDILQRVFRPMDAVLGVQAALDSLGESLAKNGKLVGYSTEGMRDNFKSLKDVIFAFKDSSNGNLQVFANNLVALRASMVKMGVTSKTAFDEIDKSLAAVKTKGKLTAKQLAAVYSAINDSMVEEQKKNIRTISDYVSDLSGVLSKAFENRYGRQDARDSITSAWISIKEAADDAKASIDAANQSLDEIKADRKVLEYQLSVAVKYGDTLRAQSIQAKLNDLTKKAAEQQTKLTEAQAVTNKSLTDNSKAGIENRSTVRDLIQSGNAYLMTLAQTGMSSAGLKDEAAKLTEEFLAQGTQLGFSRTELEAYTKYFASDFTQVLDSLEPYKNITIEVTTDYAMNAINDFVANAKAALATIPDAMPASEAQVRSIQTGAPSVATGSGGGGSVGQSPAAAAEALKQRRLAGAAATAAAAASKLAAERKAIALAAASKVPSQAKILATIKQMNELEQLVKEDNGWTAFFNPNRYNYVHDKVKSLRTDIAAFKSTYGAQWLNGVVGATGQTQLLQGYATGGFISGSGTSTSDSIPAMLSNGEYVIKANAVSKYGVDFMNSLNQMQVQNGSQFGGAGGSSSVVYLSPEDRQLLRAAVDRPIALYTENTKIAQSANAGNVLLAQRGTN